jgi:hypothetical protein
MSVYIVVATKESDIENCEAYAGAQVALGRAFQLASNKSGHGRTDLFISSPNEENMSDGSVRWVFMNTNKQSVAVYYCNIESALMSSKDAGSFLPAVSMSAPADPPIHQPSRLGYADSPKIIEPYNFLDPSLPAGWKLDGTSALMSDLLSTPQNIVDPLTLTEAQKWALVTVRVRKSPGYKGRFQGNLYLQDAVLIVLEAKSMAGENIRDDELQSLASLREDLLYGVS